MGSSAERSLLHGNIGSAASMEAALAGPLSRHSSRHGAVRHGDNWETWPSVGLLVDTHCVRSAGGVIVAVVGIAPRAPAAAAAATAATAASAASPSQPK